MRVKTESRRQAIINVALDVFREVGFQRASMAVIAQRLGGSKGTLYAYFKSKEELFEVAMKYATQGPGDLILNVLDSTTNNLPFVLRRFAKEYLNFIVGAEVLALTRTAISEGHGSSLGPHLFDQGPGHALRSMTTFFAAVMERGLLRSASARLVSRHFKALIEAGFLEEALYGTKMESDRAIGLAVDAFMRAYAVRST